MTAARIANRAAYAVRMALTERRLPGRLGNAPAVLALPYAAARVRQALRSDAAGVVVEQGGRMQGRYLYALAHALGLWRGPVRVELPPGISGFARLAPEGRLLYRHPGIRAVAPGTPAPAGALRAVVCTTSAEAEAIVDAAITASPTDRPTVAVCTDLSQPALPGSLSLPYGVYPAGLRALDAPRLAALRGTRRTLRVFFAGKLYGSGRGGHDHDLIERFYAMPSRERALRVVRERLAPEQRLVVERPADRAALFAPDAPPERRVVCTGVKGRPERWLGELARAEFFLGLPGSHMPMCHNLVEALAVGAVPILSYADWFAPALRDGVECLRYDSEDTLVAALERALAMPDADVARMRAAAAAYYDRHLAPEAAAAHMAVLGDRLRVLYVNAEDADNFRAARPDAVLTQGGTFQLPHAEAL